MGWFGYLLLAFVVFAVDSCATQLRRIADALEQQRRERLYGSDDKVVKP